MSSNFQLDQFVNEYCEAFAHGGGSDIAQFYNAPCLTVRGDGSLHVFAQDQEIEEFFENVVNTYRAEGMTGFGYSAPSISELGADCVNLSCEWIMKSADNSVIRRWNQTYTFKRMDGSWKIIASIFHV